MSASLVGSEMCIRDRGAKVPRGVAVATAACGAQGSRGGKGKEDGLRASGNSPQPRGQGRGGGRGSSAQGAP
eukprot:12892765-Alexandrium_andersonii.AAC.1